MEVEIGSYEGVSHKGGSCEFAVQGLRLTGTAVTLDVVVVDRRLVVDPQIIGLLSVHLRLGDMHTLMTGVQHG